jgi:hypothetical protein
VRIESRGGKLVIDIRTRGPDGKPIRERRNAPDGVRAQRGEAVGGCATGRAGPRRQAGGGGAGADAEGVWSEVDQGVRHANGTSPAPSPPRKLSCNCICYPVLGGSGAWIPSETRVQRVKLHLAGKSDKTLGCVCCRCSKPCSVPLERWDVDRERPHIEVCRVAAPEMSFYDFEEWERLVDGARRAGPMPLAAVLLGGEAGLRRGELVALEQSTWAVRRCPSCGMSGWARSEAPRAAIPPHPHDAASRGGDQSHPPPPRKAPPLASGRDAGQGVTTLQSWLETACRRAGLPESRNLHKLRHTFCSHLAMRGATRRPSRSSPATRISRPRSATCTCRRPIWRRRFPCLRGEPAGSKIQTKSPR